jgi:raffinose/stachyose/melibiose transport system permease protein
VVVGLIFSYAFSYNFGYVKAFFDMIGLHAVAKIDWLGNGKYALYAIVFTTVWQYAGLSMLLYISSLMDIPPDLYESAMIDGVSSWQRFKNITFPLIAPALTINSLITLIGCIRLFDLPYVMTNGGPGNATQTIAILLYKDTFMGHNAGRGAADSTVLVVIILAFSLLQNSFLRRREVEF